MQVKLLHIDVVSGDLELVMPEVVQLCWCSSVRGSRLADKLLVSLEETAQDSVQLGPLEVVCIVLEGGQELNDLLLN